MAEIYTCKMTKTMTFDIKANSMEEAYDWCATHDFEDVQKASTYWDVDYSESVSELEDDGYVAVDISYQNKWFNRRKEDERNDWKQIRIKTKRKGTS